MDGMHGVRQNGTDCVGGNRAMEDGEVLIFNLFLHLQLYPTPWSGLLLNLALTKFPLFVTSDKQLFR